MVDNSMDKSEIIPSLGMTEDQCNYTFIQIAGKHNNMYLNIYTPSVVCYDKHKKNFDIQFSMKRHETV